MLAALGFDGVAVGQWGDQAVLPKESVGILFVEVTRSAAEVIAAEQAGDGVADFADSHEAGVFHALAKAVEVAAGMAGLWWASDTCERHQRAIRAAHGPFVPDGFAIGHLQLDFAEVHGGEVLVGDAEQEVQAVAVADLAHGAAVVPGRFAAGGHDGLRERADGGDAVLEVKAALRTGMPPAGIRDSAHERRGPQRIEDEARVLSDRVGECGKDQGSVGSEGLQERVDHRWGAAGDVAEAAEGAVDHQEAAARDAETGQVANQRGAVERFGPRSLFSHGTHPVPSL